MMAGEVLVGAVCCGNFLLMDDFPHSVPAGVHQGLYPSVLKKSKLIIQVKLCMQL